MRWSFRIARISGIDVKLHVTFLLLPLLLGFSAYASGGGRWTDAVAEVVPLFMLFGCVLLHEFGHALAARHYGIATADITLLPIGGVARLERMSEDPAQELVVALAGPMVNVAIILGLGVVLGADSLRWAFTSRLRDASDDLPMSLFLLAVNVKLLLFNMIPAFPMDGGRVLRAALTTGLGYLRATRIASMIGQVFAVGFALAGLGVLLPGVLGPNWVLVFIAYFIFTAGAQEAASVRARVIHIPAGNPLAGQYLPMSARLGDVLELLVRTSQDKFPVVDDQGNAHGVLTRDAIVSELDRTGPDTLVAAAMAYRDDVAARINPPTIPPMPALVALSSTPPPR